MQDHVTCKGHMMQDHVTCKGHMMQGHVNALKDLEL